jgi:hypothetical protein
MKASELRIGNLVRNNMNGEILKPCDVLCYGINTYNIVGLNYGFIEPIPLTEEWLLKFGFEKVNNELTNIAPLNLPCTFNLPNTPFSFCQGKLILITGTGDFCVNTEYVHQFQNLYFALTGEELIFKSE